MNKNPETSATAGSEEEDDSDSYDDLDDFDVPQDMEDYLDEDAAEDDLMGCNNDDQQSTTSTMTTMSTGSVGSNTPSLVGENLESVSLGK